VRIDLGPFRGAPRDGSRQALEFGLPAGPTPLGAGIELAEPCVVQAEVSGGPERVGVRVSAHLALRCPCARCLDEVPVSLDVRYAEDWRLGARGRGPREAPESGTAEEDGWTVRRHMPRDADVEIDDGFWQNVSLEMPVKVLCAEDCRGLCPRCGVNRNHTACACRQEAPDPRLAALADWRPRKG
jgi:uncharacterized protein